MQIELPGCASLKEKRGRVKPLLARLHREFNVSTAEIDLQDRRDEALIACGWIGSDTVQIQRSLQTIPAWIEKYFPDLMIQDEKIEII